MIDNSQSPRAAAGEKGPDPMNMSFRKRATAPRMAPDQARRQGRVSRVAFETLGRSDAVIAFLNTHDDALGGRPIDLAVASEEGLLRVEHALAARPAA
jgi:uncharacterized protein (DUF2384 family)